MKKFNKTLISLLVIFALLLTGLMMPKSIANYAGPFMVFFDPNGGDLKAEEKQIYVGETYGDLPVPTREGYTFMGWHLAQYYGLEYEDPFYDNYFSRNVLRLAPGHPTSNGLFVPGYTLVFDVTIENTTPLFIDINDNDIRTYSGLYTIDGNRVYGEIEITDDDYSYWGRNAYSFLDINCADEVTSYEVNEFKLYTDSPSETDEVTSTTVFNENRNVTLIADWSEDVYYDVEFYLNGADVNIEDQRVKEGSCPVKPADPTRKYSTFDGWYSDAELTIPFDFSKPITSNAGVFAKWNSSEHDVVITFTDGMIFDEGEFKFEEALGIELIAYRGVVYAGDYEADEDEGLEYIYNRDGKLLFTIDEENGLLTFADGISASDNIVYELTDEDKELLNTEVHGAPFYISRVIISFGEYEIEEGANQTYVIGSGKDITVKANGALAKFIGLKIDGILVDESNYTKVEGSTIVTLKTAYLDTLSVGEHELTFVYNNGEVSTNLTVSDSKNPATGDSIAIYFAMMIVSVLGFVYVVKSTKK